MKENIITVKENGMIQTVNQKSGKKSNEIILDYFKRFWSEEDANAFMKQCIEVGKSGGTALFDAAVEIVINETKALGHNCSIEELQSLIYE